jgi:5-methyltetrahydrofolate--homocysteine methyltransferase
MSVLLERIKDEILVVDGAMGTFLQARGLESGECGELWNVDRREDVMAIHKAYIDAGADIIITNTFGGNRFMLEKHGFGDRACEISKAAAVLAKEAAGDRALVLGGIGPTGEFMEPLGTRTFDEMVEVFAEQVRGFAEGGADGIIIETMAALDEVKAAITAVKNNCDLPVIANMTFDKGAKGYRTMMGTSPKDAAEKFTEYGADIIGTNCGNGITEMIEIVAEMRTGTDRPLLAEPNAGLPVIEDGEVKYKETAEKMAAKVPELIAAGANIVGGCCGTTPGHITAIAQAAKK